MARCHLIHTHQREGHQLWHQLSCILSSTLWIRADSFSDPPITVSPPPHTHTQTCLECVNLQELVSYNFSPELGRQPANTETGL